jgi:predicted Zn-dependent protease
VSDLAELLQLGDEVRAGNPGAVTRLHERVLAITDVGILLDAATLFAGIDDALAIFARRVLFLKPGNVLAWEYLAEIYTRRDPAAKLANTRDALARLEDLAASSRVNVRLQLSVLLHRGQWVDAIAYSRSAIRRDPSFFDPVSVLVRILVANGGLDDAILELRRFKERVVASDAEDATWLAAKADSLEQDLRRL